VSGVAGDDAHIPDPPVRLPSVLFAWDTLIPHATGAAGAPLNMFRSDHPAPDDSDLPIIELRANLAGRVDIVTLKLFLAVVEEASIAKAAEREHMAPSAPGSFHFGVRERSVNVMQRIVLATHNV
jgi:hypothetical protein